MVEAGPDSFLSVKPCGDGADPRTGPGGEVIGSNDHLAHHLHPQATAGWSPMPDGLLLLVPTRIAPIVTTPLLSWGTKVAWAWSGFAAARRIRDRSVRSPNSSADHYGRETVDYLAEPLLSGVYGGNPEALSVRSVLPRFVELEAKYGSLSRGILAGRGAASNPAQPLFRTLEGRAGQPDRCPGPGDRRQSPRDSRGGSSDRALRLRLPIAGFGRLDAGQPGGARLRGARVGAAWRRRSIRHWPRRWRKFRTLRPP